MSVPGEYRVVVNHEGQYSLLPTGIAIPPGWRDAGQIGSSEECLAFVQTRWTDIRPLSVRRRLEGDR